jgi:hypothetical protein
LAPEFRPSDALCSGNRSGVLCGGCLPGFTQSLDGYSCITNEVCMQNVGLTWALTVIGYMIYSIYIVYSSLRQHDGLIMCLLFYGQMSLFAGVSDLSQSGAESRSAVSAWFARVAQFESIASLYSQTCYGTNMSAYAATATQLTGPAIVLFFTTFMCLVLQQARPLLRRRDIHVAVSVRATFSIVALLLFSTVTSVVFQLITCAKISDDSNDDVVFTDGTVNCYDGKWKGLIAVVVVLCLFPPAFAAALRWNLLPPSVRTRVCCAYSEHRFYWGSVTLFFRLAMSVMSAIGRSVSTLVQACFCITMLVLLIDQKPYRCASTYRFEVLCYSSLVIQFMLQALLVESVSLGVSPQAKHYGLLKNADDASTVFRCASQI